jgi:hypothetical protein
VRPLSEATLAVDFEDELSNLSPLSSVFQLSRARRCPPLRAHACRAFVTEEDKQKKKKKKEKKWNQGVCRHMQQNLVSVLLRV